MQAKTTKYTCCNILRYPSISLSLIETPGFTTLAGSPKQMKACVASSIPLGRTGTADEIAKAVVFLAPDDSSFVTGAKLFANGGVAQGYG